MSDGPRFLIVRFSAIGDCVMAAWTATSIRRSYPQAFIAWAVESRCAPVIDTQTLVDRLQEFPRDRWKARRWSPASWFAQVRTYLRLRPLRFDYGIDLQGHSKTAICLRLANPKKRVAANATDALAAKLNPVVFRTSHDLHTVEHQHNVLCTMGEFVIPTRPSMPCCPSLPDILSGDGSPLATISTGAGHPLKAYPIEQWQAVAEGLMHAGFRIAFLGGSKDPSVNMPGTIDLVGKLPLEKTLAAVAQSQLHLAADTGSGHMAAALGVPVVSVFGPKDPEEFRPYTEQGIVLKVSQNPADVHAHDIINAAIKLYAQALPH